MPIAVTVSSNLGKFQGGTYSIGPMIVPSAFPSKATTSINFPAAGYQTVAGPFGATAVLIVPPESNLVGLQLKGADGDIGIPIAPNLPCGPIPFATPTSINSVGIQAAGMINGVISITFF